MVTDAIIGAAGTKAGVCRGLLADHTRATAVPNLLTKCKLFTVSRYEARAAGRLERRGESSCELQARPPQLARCTNGIKRRPTSSGTPRSVPGREQAGRRVHR